MMRRVLLGLLLAGLVACGDDPTGPEDVTGTYTLQTVDGDGPPFTESISPPGEDGSTEVIRTTAGQLLLGPQRSCELVLTVETGVFDRFGAFLSGSSTDVTHACTFVSNLGSLTLEYADGSVEAGSLAGTTLTLTRDGAAWVFERE
jgi:hypothetical protein